MSTHCLETANLGDTVCRVDYSTQRVSPVVALAELYELLEAYSPMWYSEECHDMARAALRQAAH